MEYLPWVRYWPSHVLIYFSPKPWSYNGKNHIEKQREREMLIFLNKYVTGEMKSRFESIAHT